MTLFLLALFLLAHGLVHPLLAWLPSRNEAAIVGGAWTQSWLFGSGPTTKRLIWAACILTAGLYGLTALSTLGLIFPQAWWATLILLATGASLLTLLVFWFSEFFPGILIDLALLALVLVVHWSPLTAG